jgi:hypothetical protein
MAIKKQLALIIALTLIFSFSAPVFATDYDSPTDTGEITGEGDTKYIDLEIFSVTLSTGAILDFTLDPQGLLAIEDGATVDLGDLNGGTIQPVGGPARAINNSAVDITLSMTIKGTGDATFVPFNNDDATTIGNVKADTGNNVLLYAAPSSVDIINSMTAYSAAEKGFVITETDSELKFLLKAADYEIKNDNGVYTAKAKDDTGHGTAIQLGGYVNSTADWSDFAGVTPTKTVGISVIFEYAKAASTESADAGIAGIPGLFSTTAVPSLTLTPPVPPRGFTNAEKISATDGGTVTITRGSNVDYDIEFAFDGQDIVDVRYNGSVLSSSSYVVDKDTNILKIKGSWSGVKTITFKLADEPTVYTIILQFV